MRTSTLLSCLALLCACGGDSSPDDSGGDVGIDASDPDASADASVDAGMDAADTGSDPDACAMCDGRCGDLTTDMAHCGACGARCDNRDNAVAACIAGICEQACDEGFADCDSEVGNGCEANLDDVAYCGSCDTACETEPQSTPMCVEATCSFECDEGFDDCEAAPGCETELATSIAHCGGCDVECTAGSNASPICEESSCGFVCDEGFAACEGRPAEEGCTTDLNTSLTHCGECDNACVVHPSSIAAACFDGGCVNICDEQRGDCDGDVGNGCETNTDTSREHCGACGAACDSLSFCQEGACTRRNVAFVTSTRARPSTFGSLAGADAICATRATAAGLTGTFLAWLSDSTGSPSTRFALSTNGYVLANGVVLATDWADLTDGRLLAPFDRDEFGDEVMSELTSSTATCNRSHVVTTTRFNGTWFDGFDCGGWSGGGTGVAGETTTAAMRWTAGCGGSYICGSEMRLYCFEQ